MKAIGIYIADLLRAKLLSRLRSVKSVGQANSTLRQLSGIADFFSTTEELEELKRSLIQNQEELNEPDRAEYGDFQTNLPLAVKICELLKAKRVEAEVVVEPTFGKGSFLLAALKTFEGIQKMVGVEIYKPYVWQAKFAILEHFLRSPEQPKPEIHLFHQNVFDFDFGKIEAEGKPVLVLGNPPWMTSSMLSSLNSANLPPKSNFKNHSGFDAMTGKSNFDLGEYVSLMLVRAFHKQPGAIAFLVKNAVVKNLLFDQRQNRFQLSKMEKHAIDAAREFGAAVEASLFLARFGGSPEVDCFEFDFYKRQKTNHFGWTKGSFAANLDAYETASALDGTCPFEWRQGIKHDCSKVMELESENGHFRNGRGEAVELEPALVFGMLKSSDLKGGVLSGSRKFTIVTQRKIGQETSHIQRSHPKTWQYLVQNKTDFESRKSSIYLGKPAFSIFGVGAYSFASFKVGISGLYKSSKFSLVLPRSGKPLMLDDTCYFLGFETFAEAAFAFALLNSDPVQDFLDTIIFWDSKRAVTKDVLMRIDLGKAAGFFSFDAIKKEVERVDGISQEALTFAAWEKFTSLLQPKAASQLAFF